VVCCEGCIVTLPGPFVKDGPVSLFYFCDLPCAYRTRRDSQVPFLPPLYIGGFVGRGFLPSFSLSSN
jgi:hypothetical protein